MGVVDDNDEGPALAVKVEGLFDKAFFAFKRGAVELDVKGMAKDSQGVLIGMEGPCNVDDNGLLAGLLSYSVLDDGLARARFAHEEAKSSLRGMDLEDVEDFLLMFEEHELLVMCKGVFINAEECTYHIAPPLFKRALA
jgi:hypothetical protein